MNSKQKGDIAEAHILATLITCGYTVLLPWGDNNRYDMLIDEGGKFSRVQVKTGRFRKGCVLFNPFSVNIRTNKTEDYRGQIEYFGVFCLELNSCYLVPVDDVGVNSGSLRVEPTKNNQVQRILWAKDYEIICKSQKDANTIQAKDLG